MPSVTNPSSGDPELPAGYRVLGRLGAGGQGVVYLAELAEPVGPAGSAEPAGGGRVAVKVLHRHAAGDLGPFLAEAELIRRVRAFCTAQVVDSGVAGGLPYLVTEYVDGPSLAQVIEERGALRGAELVRLVFGTLTALTAVHQAGVVHRDFKPANVLLGRDGPRVIDFGIARLLDAAADDGELVGTPPYMAPEQFGGAEAGPPADMFAWACTVVCAATGRPPFGTGPTPVVINRILNEPPDLGGAEGLDGELRELVTACLDKDPARRPTAAGALMRLLGGQVPAREILPEGSRRAVPDAPPEGGPRTAPDAPPEKSGTAPPYGEAPARERARRPGRAVAVAAALAVALAAGGLVTARLLAADDPPSSSPSTSPPSSAALVTPPAMAAEPATRTPVPGSGVTLHEAPSDGMWVSAYQDRRTKDAPWFLRDPRSGAFQAVVEPRQEMEAAPGGRAVASLSALRLFTLDYDRVHIEDRASGDSYDIRTVDRPLFTGGLSWNREGTRVLLTVHAEARDDAPRVGFVVVDPAGRTARVTRMPATGHPYMWGPESGTVMQRGPGGAALVHGLDGTLRRTIPGVGDLLWGGAVATAGGGRFLTACPDAPKDTCVWDYRSGTREARLRTGERTTVHGWLGAEHLLATRKGRKVSEVVMLDLSGKAVRVLADGPAAEIDKISMWYTAK
ncbi:serine/threonine-protein kinase [Planobispora siamensis]|uniref:Serine/threonine protein kinase n=1 Tax=Planobispora siamensis TaxID=936338 RepID=A0A8J3SGY6_9ACTN|nr:serine/threonine-protein kinase [Planobispora siamensis]GIH91854.1 serine/threonine protein kinase [Planobispora siamensis]